MIATLEPSSPLDQWRQRLGGRRHRHAHSRPLAALGYLANGPVIDGLIEVEKLTIVLLYTEQLHSGHCALRLAGYSGNRIPWGVRLGGAENCKFFKDLSLQPVPAARGYRLDLASTELLALGLGLERELDRHAHYRQREVRQYLQLPKLWAAFRPADEANITGDGPELAAYAEPHRQATRASTGTPPPQPLRFGPPSAGMGQPPLATGCGGVCRSGAISEATGIPAAATAGRSRWLPGCGRVQLPGHPIPLGHQAALA